MFFESLLSEFISYGDTDVGVSGRSTLSKSANSQLGVDANEDGTEFKAGFNVDTGIETIQVNPIFTECIGFLLY